MERRPYRKPQLRRIVDPIVIDRVRSLFWQPAHPPAEAVCMWCGEVVRADDPPPNVALLGGAVWHRECSIRAVVGSVGHLERKCSCYRGAREGCEPADSDAAELDPPGMTRRQAAKAAADLFVTLQAEAHARGAEL
jgi:hypothetical protein